MTKIRAFLGYSALIVGIVLSVPAMPFLFLGVKLFPEGSPERESLEEYFK